MTIRKIDSPVISQCTGKKNGRKVSIFWGEIQAQNWGLTVAMRDAKIDMRAREALEGGSEGAAIWPSFKCHSYFWSSPSDVLAAIWFDSDSEEPVMTPTYFNLEIRWPYLIQHSRFFCNNWFPFYISVSAIILNYYTTLIFMQTLNVKFDVMAIFTT